jgi:hypothetical protein
VSKYWLSLMSTLKEALTVWFWYLKLNNEYGYEGQCEWRQENDLWIILSVSFRVICGMPHDFSRLGRSGLVKSKALKNRQEAPSWLQVLNERVN